MPTYVCYLPRDRFSPDQKRQIVDAISSDVSSPVPVGGLRLPSELKQRDC